MIDLDELEARCDSLISNCLGWHDSNFSDVRTVKELITRLRQAEKDAARYRWLRDSALRDHLHSLIMVHPVEWDMFNDEAMNDSNN